MPNADVVSPSHHRDRNAPPIDEGAVAAAQVGEPPAFCSPIKAGVSPGHQACFAVRTPKGIDGVDVAALYASNYLVRSNEYCTDGI